MDTSDRKKMIQQGFDTVAAGYDHPSLPFFPETAKRLVNYLQLNPAENLIDICTGTGYVALAAVEKLTEGKVIGIDLSTGMLRRASTKAEEKGHTNVEFRQLDLDHLSLTDLDRTQPFDVATSSFGLFFLEDMTRALQKIVSTVRPGGRIAISTFTGDAFSPMADVFIANYEATGRKVPPLSWKRLATEELIRQHFSAAGIENVSIHHEPLGYHMTDPQQWWDIVWNAGWRALLMQMTEQEQEEFKASHLKEISELLGNDGKWFNTEVLIAVGVK